MGSLLARRGIGCQVALLGLIGIIGVLTIAGIDRWGDNLVDRADATMSAAIHARDLETKIQIQLLQARRGEKNFLLRHDQESISMQADSTAGALHSLDLLSASVANQPDLRGLADQMTADTRRYVSAFETVLRQARDAGARRLSRRRRNNYLPRARKTAGI